MISMSKTQEKTIGEELTEICGQLYELKIDLSRMVAENDKWKQEAMMLRGRLLQK
jgi:regulator of replication initiation timing